MEQKINKKVFADKVWAEKVAKIISIEISRVYQKKEKVSIMLTGGRSAKEVYKKLVDFIKKYKDKKLDFYFGDERCVHPHHKQSNFKMVIQNLFCFNRKENLKINRIFGEAKNLKLESLRYEKILPKKIDILLLGFGDDGHIASIFPDYDLIHRIKNNVIAIKRKSFISRITITPSYIKKAKKVLVFVQGKSKGRILKKVLDNPKDKVSIPARIVIDRLWILNKSANSAFLN